MKEEIEAQAASLGIAEDAHYRDVLIAGLEATRARIPAGVR